MIANFFNKAKPINFVVLIIMLVIFFITAHLRIAVKFNSFEFWVQKMGELFLLLVIFFIFNFIVTKNKLTLNNSYALLFICLGLGLFYPVLGLSKVLISQLFIALSLRRIYSLRTNTDVNGKIFDSAFLIAISGFFYFENIFFIILLYMALVVFQRTNWRYYVIPIIGFIIPYFLIYLYALSFNTFSFFNAITKVSFLFNGGIIKHPTFFLYVDIIILTGCVAYIVKTIRTTEFSNEFRALWSLVLTHFVLAGFLIFTGDKFSLDKVFYIVFPFGVIMANYLQTIEKKWVKELIVFFFVFLTLGSVIYNFVP